jgi:hypothetical protein
MAFVNLTLKLGDVAALGGEDKDSTHAEATEARGDRLSRYWV